MDDQVKTASANLTSSLKAAMLMGASAIALKGAHWLVAQNLIDNTDAATFVSIAAGAIIAGATLAWSFIQNKIRALQAKETSQKLTAAAATGDPQADPKDPIVQAKVADAVADPNSPITTPI